MHRWNAACVVGVLLFVALNTASQNSSPATATVSGVVTDATGATLPLARVMLVDLKTFKTQTVEVREDGKFRFPDLTEGDYGLMVAGPTSSSPCWKPVFKQLDTRKVPTQGLRITQLLDLERCPKIVN
jgi:hypothetical protein